MGEGSASLDEILSSCLESVQSGRETVEQAVAHYPEQADELRPLLETATWFSGHKAAVSPRPGFVSASRRRLVEQIKTGQPQAAAPVGWLERVFGPRLGSRRTVFQLALAVVILACLVLSGSGVAFASQSTLPGDRLYPVKTGLEQAQLSLTLDTAGQIRLHTRFSQRRLAEIEALISDGRFANVSQAVTNFQYHVNQSSSLLAELARQNPQAARALALDVENMLVRQSILLNTLAANAPAEARQQLLRALVISQNNQSVLSGVMVTLFGTPTPTLPPTANPSPSSVSPLEGTPTLSGQLIFSTSTPTAGFVITATATSNTTIFLAGTATPTLSLLPLETSPTPTSTPRSSTSTPKPPTATPKPPTDTPKPPTDTPKPPTDTSVPPTNPPPPTDTPQPPQETPKPSRTPRPTHTPKPTDQPNNTPGGPVKATDTP